jgi:beta-carotene ketolase (CrtW type)
MWRWFWGFATEYVGIKQIVLNALVFNVLAYNFGIGNAVLYYVLAPMLGTFQLFYFGTYLPHKSAHAPDNIHKARSQSKNHLWAFVSCYFFGYHYEHHDQPYVAWWQLWRVKK